ncbi:hypothetical protein TNCV_5078651 [Trichonephila clavipes]|nr:hypothetical protein TNCV_5078651 [Trichonephila clavipes]
MVRRQRNGNPGSVLVATLSHEIVYYTKNVRPLTDRTSWIVNDIANVWGSHESEYDTYSLDTHKKSTLPLPLSSFNISVNLKCQSILPTHYHNGREEKKKCACLVVERLHLIQPNDHHHNLSESWKWICDDIDILVVVFCWTSRNAERKDHWGECREILAIQVHSMMQTLFPAGDGI